MARRPTGTTEPDTEAAPPPPKTHNQPPKPVCPTPETIREWLDTEHRPLTDRRQEIVTGYLAFIAKNPTIESEAAQAVATDLLKAITTFVKEAVAGHTAAKAPYLAAGQTVDGFFNVLTQNADERSKLPMVTKEKNGRSIQNALKALMTEFAEALAAERRREAEEEAKRKAAEAQRLIDEAAAKMTSESLDAAAEAARVAEKAEELAAAPAAQHSRVHGDFGGTSSLRTTWEWVEAQSSLLELAKAVVEGRAPIFYLAFNSTRIGQAVRSDKVREVPGLKIVERRSV